ncbi:MAG: hypothetical protein IV107_11340 [Paucibacter sp.]|nr:hypothetical protein [Roseateles sp.]
MKTQNSASLSPSLDAVARLTVSRELLRQSLRQNLQSRGPGGDKPWTDLKSSPAASLLIEAISAWSQGQPLRMTATLLADTLKAALAPLANRYPLGLVLGSAAAAGLLVWARPWRWGFVKPALVAGLAQQLLSKALNGTSLDSVLAMLAGLARKPPESAPAAEPPSATQC